MLLYPRPLAVYTLLLLLLSSAEAWTTHRIAPETRLSTRPFDLWRIVPSRSDPPGTAFFSLQRGLIANDSSLDAASEVPEPHVQEVTHHVDDAVESTHDVPSNLSKSRFKKKSFLLLKDLSEKIAKNSPKAVRRAQETVERLEELSLRLGSPEITVSVLTRAYNLWIHAIAKSRNHSNKNSMKSNDFRKSSGKEAEAVLRIMIAKGIKPNLISYTSVMDGYAHDAKFDQNAPHEAERLLFELLRVIDNSSPNYNPEIEISEVVVDTVINAWCQLGTWMGTQRALEILNRLELFSGSLSACRPSIHSYTTVLHGLAASRRGREAAETAEQIVDRLIMLKDDPRIAPDTVFFNAAIHAWANSFDTEAGGMAMKLLNKMKEIDCVPDLITYNSVLSAWSHSGHDQAGPQVEKLLKEMAQSHQNNPAAMPAPNTVSFNNVLHAWSKSKIPGAALRAEKVLRYMIRADDPRLAPDVFSFTSVLDAVAKSKEKDKVTRAWKILTDMLDLHKGKGSKPNLRLNQAPFNAVINAAAFSSLGSTEQERLDALQIATQSFNRMRVEGIFPDDVSYGNMMKCYVNLVLPGKNRTRLASHLFETCCEHGFVSDLVWNEAKKAIPPSILASIVQSQRPLDSMRTVDLPKKWKRHVGRPTIAAAYMKRKQEETMAKSDLHQTVLFSEVSWQSGKDL